MVTELGDAYLEFYHSAVPIGIECLRFASSALIPLVYLWVTAFRGRERLGMLGLLGVQVVVLLWIDPAGKGEWVRWPVLLGMSVGIPAEDAGTTANIGFGMLYGLLLARAAVLGRAEREAAGTQGPLGRAAAWLEDRLRIWGRWVAVGLMALVALPVLWWGWELTRGAPALIRSTADPRSYLPPFILPYWHGYRWSILLGGMAAAVAAAFLGLRHRWTAMAMGILAAAGGAAAWVLTKSLGYEFWHMYGHEVYDTCSGEYMHRSLVPAVVLLILGISLAYGPALEWLFSKRVPTHDLLAAESVAAQSRDVQDGQEHAR